MQLIIKNASKDSKWEVEAKGRFIELHKQSSYDFMDIPFIKRAAEKYHRGYAVNRRKSVEEYRKTQYEAYQAKGKGICDLHRHLRKEPPTADL